MRRRAVLASLAAAALPAAAGCSECGETWPGVGWTVTPTDLRRTGDGWEVESDVVVSFDFGVERAGVYGATLAAFAADGRIVGQTDLGNLVWPDVPEDARTETDCGDHGSLVKSVSLETGSFPRWVGLRYTDATEAEGNSRFAARYEGPAPEEGDTDRYRSVELSDVPDHEPSLPPSVADGVDLGRHGASCEDYPTPEVSTRYDLSVRWVRQLPEERFHPVLVDASLSEGAVSLDVGLRAWPRFEKLACLGEKYGVRIEADTLPDVVEIRHLSPDGDVVESTSVRRRTPRST